MKKFLFLFVISSALIITNCGSSKTVENADPYAGNWSLLVKSTPQGNVNATMAITKTAEGMYSGKINSDLGAFELYDLKIIDHNLSAGFVIQDMEFDLMGSFEDQLFNGRVSSMGESYPTTGTKIVNPN